MVATASFASGSMSGHSLLFMTKSKTVEALANPSLAPSVFKTAGEAEDK
jgi:hypothetical protein